MELSAGIGVALGFLLGIPAHQYAHHRLAVALGDQTPRLMRRLSLHPGANADPLGTYVLPGIWVIAAMFSGYIAPPFGWGKRHSLNPRTFRNRTRNVILVSLAGPLVTAIIAVAAATVAKNVSSRPVVLAAVWIAAVNVAMTVFEMLPMPGRDGGRILALFLSPGAAAKMEELEQYDVLFLLVIFLLLLRVANPMFAAGCRAVFSLPQCPVPGL